MTPDRGRLVNRLPPGPWAAAPPGRAVRDPVRVDVHPHGATRLLASALGIDRTGVLGRLCRAVTDTGRPVALDELSAHTAGDFFHAFLVLRHPAREVTADTTADLAAVRDALAGLADQVVEGRQVVLGGRAAVVAVGPPEVAFARDVFEALAADGVTVLAAGWEATRHPPLAWPAAGPVTGVLSLTAGWPAGLADPIDHLSRLLARLPAAARVTPL